MPRQPERKNDLKQERKRVAFYSRITVKRVRSLLDCDGEELSQIWFSSDEYAKMRRESSITVYRMINKEFLAADQCSRGLEYTTPEGMRKRQENKRRGLFAVLDEQESQRDSGRLHDSEALRNVSRTVSRSSQEEALKTGLSDERCVVSIRARRRKEMINNRTPGGLLREIQQSPFGKKLARRRVKSTDPPPGASRREMLCDIKRTGRDEINRDKGTTSCSYETTGGRITYYSVAA
jgi:hypothetical protein